MKTLMIIVTLVWTSTNLVATELNSFNLLEQTEKTQEVTKTEEFKVSGNCNMCKSKIEKAAKSVEGVVDAEWNKETKVISVSYNSNLEKTENVHQAIAKVGYDTDKVKADDDVYEKLHDCCKYRE